MQLLSRLISKLWTVSLIGICVILGTSVSFGLAMLWFEGYLEQWRQLPALNQDIVALVDTSGEAVYVRTADDLLYRCDVAIGHRPDAACWTPTDESDIDKPFGHTIYACPSDSRAFTPLTRPPRHIVDCIAFEPLYPDGNGLDVFALDRDGRIWYWSYISAASTWFRLGSCVLLVGVFVGWVVGMSIIQRTSSE